MTVFRKLLVFAGEQKAKGLKGDVLRLVLHRYYLDLRR